MPFSPNSLRLLRQTLRTYELSAQRASKSTSHANVRPPFNPSSHPIRLPNTSSASRRRFTSYATPTEKIRAAIQDARQQHPVLLPLLSITTFGSVCLLGLLAYDQYMRPDPLFADWPAPVENQLRMALHFTHVQPNPTQAASFFGGALKAAEHCGMDPFSKEVMGIRIRLAEMLEQFGNAKAAVEVLDGIVKDCEERLMELSRGAIQQALKNEITTVREEQVPSLQGAMLRSIIEAKVKMAQLYDSDYIQDPVSAKKTLSDAIQLLVQNTQDAQRSSFSKNNAAGLSMDEIAAMLYDMGKLYNASNERESALQVYVLARSALRKACNGTMTTQPGFVWNGKPSTPESLNDARRAVIGWTDRATKAYEGVPEKDRDSNCDQAVISALVIRAELMHQIGEYRESKDLWKLLLEMARKKGSNPSLVMSCKSGIEIADKSMKLMGQENTMTNKR